MKNFFLAFPPERRGRETDTHTNSFSSSLSRYTFSACEGGGGGAQICRNVVVGTFPSLSLCFISYDLTPLSLLLQPTE